MRIFINLPIRVVKKTSDYDKLSLDDPIDNMAELMRRVGINRVRLDD